MLPTVTGFPAQAADGATVKSNPIATGGGTYTRGAVGLQSDHAGTLSVQRYVDSGGVVPLGAAAAVALAAGTPNSVGWADGLPCGAVVVSFINGGGAVANLTNLSVLLSP